MSTKKEFRQKLRNNMTPSEIKLWKHIKDEQLSVKFRRQHSIGKYIADFYCPKLKLVIEIDGNQHHTSDGLEYDKIRDGYIKSLGIRTIRFDNKEIRENLIEVIKKIKEYL